MLTCRRQAAVVRGAALRGLEGLAPRMKQARRHYGYSCSRIFREGIDPEEKGYISRFSGRKYCGGMMDWMIAKVQFKMQLLQPSWAFY